MSSSIMPELDPILDTLLDLLLEKEPLCLEYTQSLRKWFIPLVYLIPWCLIGTYLLDIF